ncbi:MAG: hypothetical protein JRH19_24835 [Deltaproteobacteria bacterium]|nr:hypothetical protein [Deltaproteobacteria bacterium]
MVLAISALIATTASAQIRGSQHDLGTGGGAQETTALTGEVCVFCHTPHGSATTASVPLWNKTLPTTPYQRYSSLGTATLDGTEVAVGSVSLACLSCHDGTQAMDVVINASGPGGWVAGGAEIDPGAIGAMAEVPAGAPMPNLGSDLRDDHPVSIGYAGGACEGVVTPTCDPAGAASGDPDFVVAQYASLNGSDQWWVDVSTGAVPGSPGQREKTDMILYTRDFSGTKGPSVECASCHDPHVAVKQPVSFLRISNDNSDVCLACHIK